MIFFSSNGDAADFLNSSGQLLSGLAALFARSSTLAYIEHLRDTSIIYGLDLFKVVAVGGGPIFSPRNRLRNCALTVYVGNNADLEAIVRGTRLLSPRRAISPLCGTSLNHLI